MSCAEAAPYLQQWWEETYKPDASGSNGIYSGRSYWVCTNEWEGQSKSYPFAPELYKVGDTYVWDTTGFALTYVPFFAIIGKDNKVYWDSNDRNFTDALNSAINDFRTEPQVTSPIPDKYSITAFSEDIDLNTVFTEPHGNPMSFSIENISDPETASATINENILTISGFSGTFGKSVITINAESGGNNGSTRVNVYMGDPSAFSYLENGFEAANFPEPFWEIKYNTEADGGLNGANLRVPNTPTETTWILNDLSNTDFGESYIHSGGSSALIDFWAADYNWLIMPEIQLDYNDYELKYWIWFECGSYETKFHVLVNDGTNGWQVIKSYNNSVPNNTYSSEEVLSLSDFAGKTIRIAFVYEYSDGYALALDDIKVVSKLSGIESDSHLPSITKLYQNYPNPFNPETEISFSLVRNSNVKLTVYNNKGETVQNIYNGQLTKGHHSYKFNATGLTSGVYYYSLDADGDVLLKKMTLLK
jgi:hypothetical protein